MKPDIVSVLNAIVGICFFGTWIALAIGGYFLFHPRRDVAFKRKWFPRFTILMGFLFVAFTTTLSVLSARSLAGLRALFIAVPAVCLISWLNYKCTKFCGKCGAIIYHQSWFSEMRFCSKCGTELDPKPPLHDDLIE